MAQKLTGVCSDPLLQVFLDVNKSYDLLDKMCCMEILWGYGLSANLQWILESYWGGYTVVPQAGGYYDRPFKTERRVTQGCPVSPTILK